MPSAKSGSVCTLVTPAAPPQGVDGVCGPATQAKLKQVHGC